MITILHIIENIFVSGAFRSMVSIVKYSNKKLFKHKVISFNDGTNLAKTLLNEADIELIIEKDVNIILNEIKSADIVQLQWWNGIELNKFLTNSFPEMRFISFYHMVGNTEPHIISNNMINFSDMNTLTNYYSYSELDVIKSLTPQIRLEKVSLVYDSADFDRIRGIVKKPHVGFNVGYIGTVSFNKMHKNYFEMSNLIKIPDVQFDICGEYNSTQTILIEEKFKTSGILSEKFKFRGYVEDIKDPISTMDVYGYPLCENTYASGELNLQEVMYSGIPPVVFPYGGIKSLVIDNYTGFVVNCEAEYIRAIEFLYHNPDERIRIGNNASEYAKQIFGAEIASKKMDKIYLDMMKKPKTLRDVSFI